MAESGPLAAAYEYPPLRGGKLLFLTAAIATASFMEILDMTIVNVSVPAISGSLGVSTSEGTWAVSSYMLAAAIMQPLTGWIGRRFGEVRTFVTSILLFMCFSAVCGLASTFRQFEIMRFLLGVAEGGVLEQLVHTLRVTCRANAIPDTIRVDLSNLHLGDALLGMGVYHLSVLIWLYYVLTNRETAPMGLSSGGDERYDDQDPRGRDPLGSDPRGRDSVEAGLSGEDEPQHDLVVWNREVERLLKR